MRGFRSLRRERGATLVVGLIMLLFITVMVGSAFTMSGTNLKAVGNMQFRSEAAAAANSAVEQVIGQDFTNLTAEQPYSIDIDGDSTTPNYDVKVRVGRLDASGNVIDACRRAKLTTYAADESNLSGQMSNIKNTGEYDTLWELRATVTDAATGASVTVVQGVNKYMSELDANFSRCALPATGT